METNRRTQILEAAARVFARYGYQRTSMADIAAAAGISRPAIYLVFQNKEDVFRSLSEHLLASSLAAASDALGGNGSLAERLAEALLRYEGPLFEIVHNSPHGNELVDANATLAADATQRANAKLIRMIANAVREAQQAGEANLKVLDVQPKEFAELLLASVIGFKKNAASAAEFRRSVRTVSTIFAESIAPKARRHPTGQRRVS